MRPVSLSGGFQRSKLAQAKETFAGDGSTRSFRNDMQQVRGNGPSPGFVGQRLVNGVREMM